MSNKKIDIAIKGSIFACLLAVILTSGIFSIYILGEYESFIGAIIAFIATVLVLSVLIISIDGVVDYSKESALKRSENLTEEEFECNFIKIVIGTIGLILSSILGFIFFKSFFNFFVITSVISISLISDSHHAEIKANTKVRIADWCVFFLFFVLTIFFIVIKIPEIKLVELPAYTVYQSLTFAAGFTGCSILFAIDSFLRKKFKV